MTRDHDAPGPLPPQECRSHRTGHQAEIRRGARAESGRRVGGATAGRVGLRAPRVRVDSTDVYRPSAAKGAVRRPGGEAGPGPLAKVGEFLARIPRTPPGAERDGERHLAGLITD